MLAAGLCSLLGLSCESVAEPLEIGKAMPEVEGKNQDGKVVKLHEVAAEGWTLVYFYPKAATPG